MRGIDVVTLLVAVWVLVESFIVADRMDRGDRACRFVKWFFVVVGMIWASLRALHGAATWLEVWLVVAIGLFIWPTVLARFSRYYRNRIND